MPNTRLPSQCQAYQAGDRITCNSCKLAWDTNDPSPPKCGRENWKSSAIVLDILKDAEDLYRERNAVYRDNYKQMGALMLALFGTDGIPAIKTEADANRLNIIIDCLGKLQRYAFQFQLGGHPDSARDLIVYAAMLRELT